MIKRHAGYSYKILVKRGVLMLLLSAVMAIAVKIVQWVLSFFISYEDGQLHAAIVVLIAAVVGGAVYLYCAYRLGFLQKIFGRRLPGFLKKGRHAAD